jgi:hypothetical protein
VPDESLNEIALELLSRFGERPIRRLVLEAVSNKNSLAFRLQAIRALSRLAKYANPMDTMDLAILLNDRDPQVREAGRKLCGQLGIIPSFPLVKPRPKMLTAQTSVDLPSLR